MPTAAELERFQSALRAPARVRRRVLLGLAVALFAAAIAWSGIWHHPLSWAATVLFVWLAWTVFAEARRLAALDVFVAGAGVVLAAAAGSLRWSVGALSLQFELAALDVIEFVPARDGYASHCGHWRLELAGGAVLLVPEDVNDGDFLRDERDRRLEADEPDEGPPVSTTIRPPASG